MLPESACSAADRINFRALFESAPGLFLVLSPTFKIVAVSDAYLKATMTVRDSIVGRELFDVFPDNPNDPQASGVQNLRASLERVLHHRVNDVMPIQKYDIRRPDAEGGDYEERYWSPVNSPVLAAGGALQYIIHRVEDVTEFIRLRQQHAQHCSLAEELRKRATQMEADIFVHSEQIEVVNEELRRTNRSLHEQIAERRKAEDQVKLIAEELRHANQQLEARHADRTSELADANRALRREASERLCAQERLQLTVESAPNAMVMIDQSGRILLVNRQTELLFGYERSELLGQQVEILVPNRFRAEHPAQVAGYLAKPAARAMGRGRDLYGQRRDGSEFPVEIGLNPIHTADGLVVLSAIVDITERKRQEEAQRQSDLRFRGIFNQTFGFIGLLKPDGTILEVNQPALDFRGLQLADVVGQHLWNTPWFVTPEERATARQAIEQAAVGEFFRVELSARDGRDSHRVFDFTVKPISNQTGTVELMIAEARDITDQKRLELQFRQAQKMEAVGSLAGGIAHEFNNLLQAISGYTQFAIDGLSSSDQRLEDLKVVLTSAERATVLTRQLLSFGRRQVLQRSQVDPNQVVAELIKLLRPLIGENIDLRTQLAPHVVTVDADAGQLQQVLLNLCINARDAMPEGGKLIIRTQEMTLNSAFCATYPCLKPGQYVALSVADSGHGMTPEIQARIFEPFFTTKELGKGTGLGLAMVYGMVQQHGGLILVKSKPDFGTTFKIYLPAADAAVRVGTESSTCRTEGGSETILVAEDESVVRNLAARILRRAGYSVLAAKDGAEAVALFNHHAENISMALLDAVMPKLNGHQVYERIKQRNAAVPVVFCSGHDPETSQVKLLVGHGGRMLQKPFTPEALLRLVREVIDERNAGETALCQA